jgi:hypothetical protein
MGKSKSFLRQHRPSFDEQIYRMKSVWAGFALTRSARQVESLWTGTLQPSPMSAEYLVTVLYKPGCLPVARVISPELKVREGYTDLPHVYPDSSLCLSVLGDWEPWMYVADYIVPWVSEWLLFYELWHATGFWYGGGTHPEKLEHRCASM